jgi:hypothetical protein
VANKAATSAANPENIQKNAEKKGIIKGGLTLQQLEMNIKQEPKGN